VHFGDLIQMRFLRFPSLVDFSKTVRAK